MLNRGSNTDASSVSVQRVSGLDVELFRATSLRHSFDRHAHESIAIGVIDEGIGEFWCRRATHRVPADTVVLLDPGEVHTGGVARGAGGLGYRMVYVPVPLAQLLIDQAWPPFAVPAAHAPRLAAAARYVHDAANSGEPRLATETALCELLLQTAMAFADCRRPVMNPVAPGARRMALVRDFLHANATADVCLMDLASLADLTPSYVSRQFRRQYGLPPHAYQLQVRLAIAKRMLRVGESIATTAIALGYADQSHFSTAFKRSFGITPGAYRRGIRAREA